MPDWEQAFLTSQMTNDTLNLCIHISIIEGPVADLARFH